ncbi:MAG: hypothetical protein KBC91_00850 [Candidatus Omnitrophica bacterium]|nr:hypothetical protein [Candidatus Omnitrophota bacterium]
MANSKSKGTQTILWWVAWITLTIVSFFAAAAFWTPLIAHYLGSVRESRNAIIWITAVFGTWMIFLVPLIVFMYQKVDKAYEDARIRREQNANRFRSILVPEEKRRVPSHVSQKLAAYPPTVNGGHLVNITLQNGSQVPNVFISECREMLGVYNARELTFEAKDIRDIDLVDMNNPPAFLTTSWLRLDGATAPQ